MYQLRPGGLYPCLQISFSIPLSLAQQSCLKNMILMTESRAQEQEQSLDPLVDRVCMEQNCGTPVPSSDPPEKVSFVHPRTKNVSLQDRISDWSKGFQNDTPSDFTSEESQTLSLSASDRPFPFSDISCVPVTIFKTGDTCLRSVIQVDADHPHCQDYRDWIYNRFKDTVFKEGGNHWSEIKKNMDKRSQRDLCLGAHSGC